MPSIAMLHEEDPRDVLMRKVGDISGVEVFANDVLCAIYRRPKVTRGEFTCRISIWRRTAFREKRC